MRGPFTIIDRYVVAEYCLSFIVAFLFFFSVFFVNQMLLMAENILSNNVPLGQVLKLIFFSLPAVIAFALPFSGLVGALMALGRLSTDNEILAFQSSGVSLARLFVPIVGFSMVLTAFTFIFSDYFIPLGNLRFNRLYREVLYSNPALELEPYSVKRYQDSFIVTGNVDRNHLEDVLIIDRDANDNKRIILAREAFLDNQITQEGVISLNLRGIISHSTPEKIRTEFDYTFSDEMVYNILLKEISLSMRNPTPREMSSRDVYDGIVQRRGDVDKRIADNERSLKADSLEFAGLYAAETEKAQLRGTAVNVQRARELLQSVRNKKNRSFYDYSLQMYEVEFQKKFSLPFACLVFAFLAFPVGILTHKSGRAVGFAVGIFVSLLYYGLLFLGQSLGTRMDYSPVLSMWLPNVVIFIAGLILFLKRIRQ